MPAPATDILNERAKAPKEMPPDDVRGYDVRTGKLLWTFHVVPRKGEFGNETWLNDSWTYSGNSGVWSLISADEELGYVYLPFEDSDRRLLRRHAARATTCSPKASCASTRRPASASGTSRRCTTASGTTTCRPRRCSRDITVNGRRIKALAQVTKQAFVYVLDRDDRPAGVADRRAAGAAGQRARRVVSPTQPIPTKPPAFDQQGVSENDLIDFTPELKAEALKIVSEYKYRPALHAARSCKAVPTDRRARS